MSDLTKLPKWAQERIRDLERQREGAVKMLMRFKDDQTPSPVSYFEMSHLGELGGPNRITRYVQTNRIRIEHADVELDIFLAPEHDGQREYGIELSWCSLPSSRVIALVPTGYQKTQLVAPEHLRRKR